MKKLSNILIVILVLLSACSDPYENQSFSDMENMPAASYMNSPENAPTFSLWTELLQYTDLFNTLNLSHDYTCFVPVNEAMQDFLNAKGLSSVREMQMAEAINLVKYHTIRNKMYETSDFSDGMFPDSTASGDYLSIEFREGGFDATYVNGEARIVKLNIQTTNAVIHTLEKVLTPVTGTIMDKLSDQFSIMRAAVTATGYDKNLSQIYQDGKKFRYTLFAVSDKVFNDAQITNVASLATHLGAEDTNYQSSDNKLNQYVAYHMMNSSMSFVDLTNDVDKNTSKNLSVMAENQLISFSLHGDLNQFYLNYDEQLGYGIEITEKNVNCKNGVLHVVDDLMEVRIPSSAKVQWDLADYPEMAAICKDYQKENMTSPSTQYFTDEDTLTCYNALRGNGSYQYYVASKNDSERYKAKNKDYLVLGMAAYGWIEMQSPTIIAGKYNVIVEHFNVASSEASGKLSVIIDGEYVGGQFTTRGANKTTDKFTQTTIGEVEFKETLPHTVRILAGDGYSSYLDCITFDPVK